MVPWIALTLVALAGLLVAEGWCQPWVGGTAKALASTGFVGLGVAAGALDSGPGQVLFAALILCMLGDLLLIGRSKALFLAGLGAFLLGHLAYAVSFGLSGLSLPATGAAALALVVPAVPVLRWLWPHVRGKMRGPVAAYIVVITLMVATSAGALAAGAPWTVPAGAVLFYLSDICVARNRFVSPGSVNRYVGLPLYYGGQLLLAASAGGL